MLVKFLDCIFPAFEFDGLAGGTGRSHEIEILKGKIPLFKDFEEGGTYYSRGANNCDIGFSVHLSAFST